MPVPTVEQTIVKMIDSPMGEGVDLHELYPAVRWLLLRELTRRPERRRYCDICELEILDAEVVVCDQGTLFHARCHAGK